MPANGRLAVLSVSDSTAIDAPVTKENAMVVRSSSTGARDKLFKEALELEQQDRAELAKLLIDSLDPTTEQDVEEAWIREIDRRAAELDSGTAQTIPWETIRARLRHPAGG
jgi:putative addiction module component (TIGR02574 family)